MSALACFREKQYKNKSLTTSEVNPKSCCPTFGVHFKRYDQTFNKLFKIYLQL